MLLRPLAARGWRFRDPADESIQALVHASPSASPEAVEAVLLDTDLRLFGGKTLPDRASATSGKRLSYLHGPIVLQVNHRSQRLFLVFKWGNVSFRSRS
jgi:tudor domain-containing protein 3